MPTDFSPQILDQLLGGALAMGTSRVDADHVDHDDVALGAAATPSLFIRKLPFNSFSRELESHVASYCTLSIA